MKHILVVNPAYNGFQYGTYAKSVNQAAKTDFQAVAVFTDPALVADAPDWEQVMWTGMESLVGLNPVACFPGSDSGLAVSEWINSAMNLPSMNKAAQRTIRQSKALTLWHLENMGLTDATHFVTTGESLEESLAWANGKYPVYLKPDGGTGGDQVFKIHYEQELAAMLPFVLSGGKNGVLQTEARGIEYKIDTVSHSGVHKIVGVWKAQRGDRTRIDLVDPKTLTEKQWFRLQAACFKALDALGFVQGSCLLELVYDPFADKLSFLEVNFRQHGHLSWQFCIASIGTTQIRANVLGCISHASWKNLLPLADRWEYKVPSTKLWIKNKRTRYIHFDLGEVMRLGRSVQHVITHPHRIGGIMQPAQNSYDGIAAILLQNANVLELEEDIQKVWSFAESRFS